jgi:hypothetical protein
LLVGHDVDLGGGPLGAVEVGELLEHDLDFLAVGRGLGDEVEALPRYQYGYGGALQAGWHTFAFFTSAGVSSP